MIGAAPFARALERGQFDSEATRAASRWWARHAKVERPVLLPAGATVIGVGGATLGGSGKTPLTLALARALAERGESVAVVAHGYGASVRAARRVHARDTAVTAGDDAVWLASDLASAGVPVFTGARNAAIALAAAGASFVVVDALLQALPERLALSLLAADPFAPWGAGQCPPAGDLRAPRETLLSLTDAVVGVGAEPPHTAPSDGTSAGAQASLADALASLERAATAADRPCFAVGGGLEAAHASSGATVAFSALSGVRVGLVLAVARPDRVIRSLRGAGVRPTLTRLFSDHARPRASLLRVAGPPVDVWVTTPKCATKLGALYEGAPVVIVRHRLSIPDELVALCGSRRRGG